MGRASERTGTQWLSFEFGNVRDRVVRISFSSMKKDDSFRDYLLHDLLADVYDVEIRAMMGGNMIRKS